MNAPVSLPGLTPHRITVEELLRFQNSGAFDGLPRMELLEGVLYEMSPQTSAHVRVKNRLCQRFSNIPVLGANGMEAFVEPTIVATETSCPEPDVAICDAPDVEGYFPSSSIRLAIEVSVSTLQTDLGYKLALYAEGSIPEYWVVDVTGKRIHQFWAPQGKNYTQTQIVELGSQIAAVTIDGLIVDTDGLG